MQNSGGHFDDANWNEHEHPRDPDGKFTAGAGSAEKPLKWKNPVGRIANVYKKPDGKWMYQLKTGAWTPLESSQIESVEKNAYDPEHKKAAPVPPPTTVPQVSAAKYQELAEKAMALKQTKAPEVKAQGAAATKITAKLKDMPNPGTMPLQAYQMLDILHKNNNALSVEELQQKMVGVVETKQTMAIIWNFYANRLQKEGYVELTSPVIDYVAEQKEYLAARYQQYGSSTAQLAKNIGLNNDPATRNAIRAQLRKLGVYKETEKAAPGAPQMTAASQVKPQESKIPVKPEMQKLASELVAKIGASPTSGGALEQFKAYATALKIQNMKEVSSAISNWTGSSHSGGAQWMKMAACKVYGKDPAKEYKLDASDPNLKAKAEEIKDPLLAQKEWTKAWVKKYGAKTVYRGLKGNVAESIRKQIQAGKTEIEFNANVLSSWSESKSKATGFAKGGFNGVVLKQSVDPEHVWACHNSVPFAFSAYKSEMEYIMGHPSETFKIKASDITLV